MFGKPVEFRLGEPRGAEVLVQLLLGVPDPACFLHCVAIRRNFRRTVNVFKFFVEQRFPVPMLLDVDKLMDDVQVDVVGITGPQVIGRNDQVAVIVIHGHISGW